MKIKGLSYLGNIASEAKLNGKYIYRSYNLLDEYAGDNTPLKNIFNSMDFYDYYDSYKGNTIIFVKNSAGYTDLVLYDINLKELDRYNTNISYQTMNINKLIISYEKDLAFIQYTSSLSAMFKIENNKIVKLYDVPKATDGTYTFNPSLAKISKDGKYLIASYKRYPKHPFDMYKINENGLTFLQRVENVGEIDKFCIKNGINYFFVNSTLNNNTTIVSGLGRCYKINNDDSITSIYSVNLNYIRNIEVNEDLDCISVRTAKDSSQRSYPYYQYLYYYDFENPKFYSTSIRSGSSVESTKTLFFKYNNINYAIFYDNSFSYFNLTKIKKNEFITILSNFSYTPSYSPNTILDVSNDYIIIINNLYRYFSIYNKKDLINASKTPVLSYTKNKSDTTYYRVFPRFFIFCYGNNSQSYGYYIS